MFVSQHPNGPAPGLRDKVPEIVIVAPSCDPFADFMRAAQAGEIGLHFCVNGHSALRLSRRFPAAAWIVAADLPDMSGVDLVEMLAAHSLQRIIDPPSAGTRSFLDQVSESLHAAVFIVSEGYRLADEQRALAAGVAGFFVHPVTLDVIRDSLQHAAAGLGADLLLG